MVDGNLQNGDHLLAVGEVRLWGMGAEQVASILRQAGQDSIRLVIARPIDPTVPNYLVNSVVVPTKVLNDPMELENTLQCSLLHQSAAVAAVAAASNGFSFDPSAFAAAAAATAASTAATGSTASNGELGLQNAMLCSAPLTSTSASDFAQKISLSSDESTFPSSSSTPPMLHNIALPLLNGPTPVQTIVTTNGVTTINPPLLTLMTPSEVDGGPHLVEVVGPSSPAQSSSTTICEADVHQVGRKLDADLEAAKNMTCESTEVVIASVKDISETIVRHTQTSDISLPTSIEEIHDEVLYMGKENVPSDVQNIVLQPLEKNPGKSWGKSSSFKLHGAQKPDPNWTKDSGKKLVRKTSVPASLVLTQSVKEDEDAIQVFRDEDHPDKIAKRSGGNSKKKRLTKSPGSKVRTGFPTPSTFSVVLPEKEEYKIELHKGTSGLGITVAGYVCEKEDLCGIFVKSIIPGSIADECGNIFVNDQITEVDGVALNGFNNQQAVDMLKRTGESVRLTIVRYLRGLKFEELKQGIYQANVVRPNSPIPISPASTNEEKIGQDVKYPKKLSRKSSKAKREADGRTSPKNPIASRHNSIPNTLQEEICATGTSIPSSISVPMISSPNKSTTPTTQQNPSEITVINLASLKPEASETDRRKHIIKEKWETEVEENNILVIAFIQKPNEKSGLGISLEGTVDVEDGREVRPHHYIRSILPGGPVSLEGSLRSGDELLEVNGKRLKGLFHVEVVRSLRNLPAFVGLVCSRKQSGPSPVRGTIVHNFETGKSQKAFESRKILSGSLQSLLAAREPEFLMKAKSEVSLLCTTSQTLSLDVNGSHSKSSLSVATPQTKVRAKSLENLNCGAMWSSFIEEIVLFKREKGLGFSILDYQDPLKMTETVIVIRSLIPGGVAQQDQRIVPGDRLVYVNDVRLDNASLDMAVQALKGAPFGPVRLGIAKPITDCPSEIEKQNNSQTLSSLAYASDCNTQEESNISDIRTDPISPALSNTSKKSWIKPAEKSRDATPTSSTIDEGPHPSVLNSRGFLEPARNIPILPQLPKYSIIVKKEPHQPFGVTLEALAFELCGTLVRDIDPEGAVGMDSRLRVGDLILFLNHESMWRVTSSQAKIILRRAEFVSTGIPIIFIPEEHLLSSEEATSDDVSASEATSSSSDLQSFSESFKLSDIKEESQIDDNNSSSLSEPTEEIHIDLTVKSAAILRFPSDLIESSVDPPQDLELSLFSHHQSPSTVKNSFVIRQNQLEVTSSQQESMVRVYQAPTVTSKSQHPGGAVQAFNGGMKKSESMSESKPTNISSSHCWGEPRSVNVYREPGKGLGISIVGGKIDSSPIDSAGKNLCLNGIFIKNVINDSPAGRTGQFFTGDRILEINGIPLATSDQSVAAKAIRNSEDPVRLVVQSLLQPDKSSTVNLKTSYSNPSLCQPTNENFLRIPARGEDLNANANIPSHVSPPSTPEVVQQGLSDLQRQVLQQKIQAEIVAKQEEHLTVLKKANVDCGDEDPNHLEVTTHVEYPMPEEGKMRAGALKSLSSSENSDEENEVEKEETINNMENFKCLPGDLIETEIQRDDVLGFGLALSGHMERNRMATFICGIRPKSPAFDAAAFQPGDELLKVHQTVVRGRSHLNVSVIIKKLPTDSKVKIIALRHANNMDKIAIREFTHFSILLDDVIFGAPEFSPFIAKREVKIQKTAQGLGLMIIEGSHKVLGKGIFISDLQQNSLAFKANLKVGDKILAVNTESFLTMNHDEASQVLKQCTGIVRILVVNPSDEVEAREKAPEIVDEVKEQNDNFLLSVQETSDTSRKGSVVSTSSQIPKSPTKSPVKSPDKSLAKSLAELPGLRTPAKSPTKCPGKSLVKSPIKGENKIEIKKDSSVALGIDIKAVSAFDERQIMIDEIYEKGAVHKDGRLKPGDVLLSINENDCRKMSLFEAKRLIRLPADKVTFILDCEATEPSFEDFDVELQRKPGKGLGLTITGKGIEGGIFISDLVPGGLAAMSGQLCPDDQLLSVNGRDLMNEKQDDGFSFLKMQIGAMKMKIRRYKTVAGS